MRKSMAEIASTSKRAAHGRLAKVAADTSGKEQKGKTVKMPPRHDVITRIGVHDSQVYLIEFRIQDAADKIALIRKGVKKIMLARLKEKFDLDYDQLAAILLSSRTVLINKKGTDTFNQDISERIVALTELYSYGYEVFEDAAAFNRWMKKENRALGNRAPISLLDTLYGMNEIRHLIGRIDYGVFS